MQIKRSVDVISGSSDFHSAVKKQDTTEILSLRQQGYRPVVLDDKKQSPLDTLDKMENIDDKMRSQLHLALLGSLNPTAPMGYTKPEALHGTPWGFEILQTGALIGGINDAKGGSQSLEGKIFFSDRKPEKPDDFITRENFRGKARIYSQGKGIYPSNAASRALQHRVCQAVLLRLTDSGSLQHTASIEVIKKSAGESDLNAMTRWLKNLIFLQTVSKPYTKLAASDDATLIAQIKFPGQIILKSKEEPTHLLKEEDLAKMLKISCRDVMNQMESGKAPLLSLVNNGTIVPMIFGFAKIESLKTHTILSSVPGNKRQYSYQDDTHSLSGTSKGGCLKELELQSRNDVKTLLLSCLARNVAIPENVVIRIKSKGHKAEYLDNSDIVNIKSQIINIMQDADFEIATAGIRELQIINTALRAENP